MHTVEPVMLNPRLTSAICALALTSSLGCALSGETALHDACETFPSPPKAAIEEVLERVVRTTLSADVMAGATKAAPRQLCQLMDIVERLTALPKIVVMQDSDYITPAILPEETKFEFSLLGPNEITDIASLNGDFLYLRLELRALSTTSAEVRAEIVPTKRHCCLSQARMRMHVSLVQNEHGWQVESVRIGA